MPFEAPTPTILLSSDHNVVVFSLKIIGISIDFNQGVTSLYAILMIITLISIIIIFKEILAMENALSVLIIAGAFLTFSLGILALSYARKISKS